MQTAVFGAQKTAVCIQKASSCSAWGVRGAEGRAGAADLINITGGTLMILFQGTGNSR
jgi:hypothetical protein